ncbi:MAG: hypothetical protein MSG64_17590 [Pyrinomonadaceae bacterium MAG19_C2-C3]|nr:hypothetical protein [Pyrinomonadaceae bacterium MAG19_C2-C3]
MQSTVARALDDEFQRTAKAEGIALDELVAQIATLLNCRARQIYNYRCGKTPLPAESVPVLCRRFRSQALLFALVSLCDEQVDAPDDFDLVRLVSQQARKHLSHHERMLEAFEDGVISSAELSELENSKDRLIRGVLELHAIAVDDYRRRTKLDKERCGLNSHK